MKPLLEGMRTSFFRFDLALIGSLLIAAFVAFRPGAAQSPAARALDATTAIPAFIADGTGKIGFRSSDRELARWALDAWQRSSGKSLRFEPAVESAALIRLYW